MKKVLIITYYWPPSGGIGVLRCLKIAKYLRRFGWEPIIYTAKDAHYPSIDHSNDKDVPADVTVIRKKIWEPYRLYKIFTRQNADANVNDVFYVEAEKVGWKNILSIWIRSNFFIPDARAMWIKPSVKFLKGYIRENQVDAMLTCGPPHTNTRIATLLKKETGIPWLADFQDPWTQVDYYKSLILTPWSDKKHHRYEREAFLQADKITIVSPTWKKDLESIGARNVSVIPWGYDPEDYLDLNVKLVDKFTFTHIGIMGYDRNPHVFLQVVREMCNEISGFAESFELRLVGQVDHTIKQVIEKLDLNDNVNFVGSVPRKKALELTLSSSALLLLLNQQDNAMGRIPGKLFEYLAVKRPICCLGPTDGDVSHILNQVGAGSTVEYADADGIFKLLSSLFEKYKKNILINPIDSSIGEYSIERLSGKIAGFLNEISK